MDDMPLFYKDMMMDKKREAFNRTGSVFRADIQTNTRQQQEASYMQQTFIQQPFMQQSFMQQPFMQQRFTPKKVKQKKSVKSMVERKNQKLQEENSRQMVLHAGKIGENAELRPSVIQEWLDGNLERLAANITKITDFVNKPETEWKAKETETGRAAEQLIHMDINEAADLTNVGEQYQRLFERMSKLPASALVQIPEEVLDFVACQVVLFEKRDILEKELEALDNKGKRREQADESGRQESAREGKKKQDDLLWQEINNEEAFRKMATKERDERNKKEQENVFSM